MVVRNFEKKVNQSFEDLVQSLRFAHTHEILDTEPIDISAQKSVEIFRAEITIKIFRAESEKNILDFEQKLTTKNQLILF